MISPDHMTRDGTRSFPVQLASSVTVWPDADTRLIMAREGLRFGPVEESHCIVSGPEDDDAWMNALLQLDRDGLGRFRDALFSAPKNFARLLAIVEAFRSLEAHCTSPHPNYPLGGKEGIPYSLPMDAALHARFEELLDSLAQQGITMKMGAEFEFALEENPLAGMEQNFYVLGRMLMAEEIIRFGDARISEIAGFSAGDILMLNFLEHDPVTMPVFQHAFGRDGGGRGYYDNERVFELRTHTLDANGFFPAYHAALKRVFDTVLETRVPFIQKIMQHLSVSFWRDGRNILLCETPEDETTTHAMMRALGWMLEDGHMLMMPSRYADSSLDEISVVGPSRLSFVRHAYGRLEFRAFSAEGQHMVIGAVMAAGALDAALNPALSASIDKGAQPLRRLLVPGVRFGAHNDLPWLSHAFNSSALNPVTGAITPDMDYIEVSASKILQQINEDDPYFAEDHMRERIPEKLTPSPEWQQRVVHDLVASPRILPEGRAYKIMWPDIALPLSPNTVVELGLIGDNAVCTGVSPRFKYMMPKEQPDKTRMEILRDHPILPHVFGAPLYQTLLTALERDRYQGPIGHRLLETVISGLADRLGENDYMDDGCGHALVQIPLHPRPFQSAKIQMKDVMRLARRPKNVVGAIFRDIHLHGLSGDPVADLADAVTFKIAFDDLQVVHQHLSGLSSALKDTHKKPAKGALTP